MLANGVGLPIDGLLREYAHEFNSRLWQHGPTSFPTSFSFLEAFLEFRPELNMFTHLPERDTLFSGLDFVAWLTSTAIFRDLNSAWQAIPEKVVLSFSSKDAPFASTSDRGAICVIGVALVRHENEITAVMLFGDANTYLEDISKMGEKGFTTTKPYLNSSKPQRWEKQKIHKSIDALRRVAVARFELRPEGAVCANRFLASDAGDQWITYTDDFDTFREVKDTAKRNSIAEKQIVGLEKDGGAFEFLTTCLFLPLYKIHAANLNISKVPTKLDDSFQNRPNNQDYDLLPVEFSIRVRELDEIAGATFDSSTSGRVLFPRIRLHREGGGMWRILLPWQRGFDETGAPSSGKTWIEDPLVSQSSFDGFVEVANFANMSKSRYDGDDSGFLYVARCEGHMADLFKIGVTRQSPRTRMRELSSSTSAPSRFDFVKIFDVPKRVAIEKKVHERLESYRWSLNREFFKCPLATIESIIKQVASEVQGLDRQS